MISSKHRVAPEQIDKRATPAASPISAHPHYNEASPSFLARNAGFWRIVCQRLGPGEAKERLKSPWTTLGVISALLAGGLCTCLQGMHWGKGLAGSSRLVATVQPVWASSAA